MTSLRIFVYSFTLRIIYGVRMLAGLLHIFEHRVLFIYKENVPAT
jgi:hypothetical protein